MPPEAQAPALTSRVPWLSDDEYRERLQAAIDGDPEALHSLFFGPSSD